MKKLEELQQSKKEYSPEVMEFFNELHQGSIQNIEDMKKKLEDAEKELNRRRNLGENI